MLKTYSLSPSFDRSSRVFFHYPDIKPPMDVILGFHDAQVKVHGGSPPGVIELNDVYLLNGDGHNCLYDSNGRRIDQTCVRRGANGGEFIQSEIATIALPEEFETIREPVLYLAGFYRHWGHFLTETISRLWARYEYPELGKLTGLYRGYFPAALTGYRYVQDYFDAMSTRPLRLASATHPTRIEKCFVPAASFSNRNEAYAAHLLSTRDVARSLLKDSPGGDTPPVYLSRSRLKGVDRIVVNEVELENLLRERGFRIVFPESLTLREQVEIFNRCKTIVGCTGSALHSSMFILDSEHTSTYTLCHKWINENYTMCDRLVGHDSHYLCVLERETETPEAGAARRFAIDLPAVIAQFSEFGLI